MKKVVLLLMVMFTSFNSFSQQKEVSNVFNSEKYQLLKKYYIESISSGKTQELDALKKEIIYKVGRHNFTEITNSKDIDSWLKNNWKSTSFASFEESEYYFNKLKSLSNEVSELTKKMTPLFTDLKNEVGYSALFKKLSEDYNKSIQVTSL